VAGMDDWQGWIVLCDSSIDGRHPQATLLLLSLEGVPDCPDTLKREQQRPRLRVAPNTNSREESCSPGGCTDEPQKKRDNEGPESITCFLSATYQLKGGF
jgi:hypothetical protein